jgi:hypothetical protein
MAREDMRIDELAKPARPRVLLDLMKELDHHKSREQGALAQEVIAK